MSLFRRCSGSGRIVVFGVVLVLLILGVLGGTSSGSCGCAGTWRGYDGEGMLINLQLRCDGSVVGTYRANIQPYCTITFDIDSTYTWNSSDGLVSFSFGDRKRCTAQIELRIEMTVGLYIDEGCNNLSGTFSAMGYIYYGGEPAGEIPGSGTWSLNRTTSPRGGLRMTIEPAEARSAGARWRVDGGIWRTSGYTQGSLTAGWHTVEFKSIGEWRKPSDQEICVDPGLITTSVGTYVPSKLTISGIVTDNYFEPLGDVRMTGWPGAEPVTDSTGYYSGVVPYGWSGTITPSKPSYTFSPSNRSYIDVASDKSNEDYIGTAEPISSVEIATGWDYGEPDTPNDLRYEFFFRIAAAETVSLVKVDTAGGITFEIPNDVNTQSGEIQTRHYVDGGIYFWEYEGAFAEQRSLADYGDGSYTISVYHQNDSNDQTSVWYGVPGESNAIGQPVQEPVLIFPQHNGATRSPVTFEWDACTDVNATSIRLSLANEDMNELEDISFDVAATNSGSVVLGKGIWETAFCLDHFYEFNNADDVIVVAGKYSKSDYAFSITLSPLGHWAMDDDEPDTTVVDSSGYGNHGTAQQNTSVMRTEGMIDGALAFDGTNDYVDCGTDASLDVSGSVSISAWVKLDGLWDHQTIVAKRGAAGDKHANYALRTGTSHHASEDELQFYYHDGTSWHVYTTSNANLTTGQWYHVVSTFTFGIGAGIKCYVNNNLLVGSWTIGDGNSPAQSNTQPVTIGGLTSGERLAGLIDEVMIFDEALSAEEISALFNEGTGLRVDLTIDELWMYQSLPGQTGSTLTAGVSVTDDPMSNSSYSYAWEIVLPGDVTLAPVPVDGGGAGDAYWTFAARGCDEPGGLSDSGQTFKVRVTVTGDDYDNTGQAEAEFGIALLGDVNNDGIVNIVDRSITNVFWRMGSAGPYTLRDCDVTSDGIVNVVDRSIVNAVWRGMTGQNSVSSPCPLR